MSHDDELDDPRNDVEAHPELYGKPCEPPRPSRSSEPPPYEDLMRYEEGEMTEEEVIALFQRLIDSGLAWSLQGSYGRQAAAFIEAGVCHL
jgi:hypothetical protein